MNTDCLPPGRRGTGLVRKSNGSVPRRLGGFVFLGLLLIAACKKTAPEIRPAFFHWKTQLALQPSETALLDSLHCNYLYIKFLDIAREDGEIRPYALLELSDTLGLNGKTIIPCIFITNSVFQNISEQQLDWLAQKTTQALKSVGKQFEPAVFSEIQFDCDWTASTRAAFFSFLKKMRSELPKGSQISATIRLHQYKFPDRTGVPPADRGMLMLYNTGDIENPDEQNSIFRTADAEKYIRGAAANYQLPLDLALPLFSWAVVYRHGALWKIIPEPEPAELRDTSRFSPFSPTSFLVETGTLLGEQYLSPGDLVRLESVPPATLLEAASLAKNIDLAGDARLGFFYLDTVIAPRYPTQFLQQVIDTLEKE